MAGGGVGSEAPSQDLQLSECERAAKSCLGGVPFGLWAFALLSSAGPQHPTPVCSVPSFCPLPSAGSHHRLQSPEPPLIHHFKAFLLCFIQIFVGAFLS